MLESWCCRDAAVDDAASLTDLIHRARKGDADAADRLFSALYAELRRLARARLRAGGRNTLLDTSSLVHRHGRTFNSASSSHACRCPSR